MTSVTDLFNRDRSPAEEELPSAADLGIPPQERAETLSAMDEMLSRADEALGASDEAA